MNKCFVNALPVFSKEHLKTVNVSLLFKIDFLKEENISFFIAGESEFQIFLNRKLIGYGPARGAHGYHRVDKYDLHNLEDNNRLVILITSYRAHTFDRVNQSPFIQFELRNDKHVIASSNLDSEVYLYEPRYQKVCRFSYQRAFTESYNDKFTNDVFKYGHDIPFQRLSLCEVSSEQLINRNVHYPRLDESHALLKEKNSFFLNDENKIYEDRYMFNEGLVIFDKKDWEKDTNEVVSKISLKDVLSLDNIIKEYQSLAFVLSYSETGFIRTKIRVIKDIDLYIYFDERSESDTHIEFNFYRNRTQDIISYELKPGEYDLISFIPYTAKCIRLSALKGEAYIDDVSIIILENPDSYKLQYQFNDEKLKEIFASARRTFASNALDILTDCPSRERAGWLCDSYFSGRAEKLFTGMNLVERNLLENYALYKYHGDMEKGMVPMCYPADFFNNEMYIPNWAMFYVVELESYFSRNKDEELKNISKHNVQELVQFFKKYENEFGLLEDLENWIMIDWSKANDPESIKGVNIPSNALYAAFLDSAAYVLDDESLSVKAKNVRKQIKDRAFDGKFFVDNLIRNEKKELIRNNRICEASLYYLFYFGVATKEEYPELFEILLNDFGPNRDTDKVYPNIYKANVFIGDYLRLEILLRYGYTEKVLNETVDYFYKMAKTTGTLWEHDSPHGSLNHGFASYAANIIFQALTGIYKIDYLNKVIYKRQVQNKTKYKFLLPVDGQNITLSDESDNLIDGYKIVTEE